MTYLRLLGLISLAAIAGPAFATTAEGTPSQIAPPRTESIAANGLTFSYRMYGPRSGRPILLINGVGMQLVDWPPEFIQGLVTRKFRVIVFDSRDVGQTTHFTAADPPDWPAVFKAMSVGSAPPLAYSVADMATDTAALLEALHTPRADIVGASGGAAIAELLALQHPERVRSLTLLFANSGNPLRRFPADPARASGIPQPTAGETPDQSVERRLQAARALAGRGHPFDEARARRMATIAASRDRDPFGLARQGAAQIALGDVRLASSIDPRAYRRHPWR